MVTDVRPQYPGGRSLARALARPHQRPLPARRHMQFSSGLPEHHVQALILQDWKPRPRERR